MAWPHRMLESRTHGLLVVSWQLLLPCDPILDLPCHMVASMHLVHPVHFPVPGALIRGGLCFGLRRNGRACRAGSAEWGERAPRQWHWNATRRWNKRCADARRSRRWHNWRKCVSLQYMASRSPSQWRKEVIEPVTMRWRRLGGVGPPAWAYLPGLLFSRAFHAPLTAFG
jgi:hypothetical protein